MAKSCLLGVKNGSYEDVAIVSRITEGFDKMEYIGQIRKINESLSIGERVTRAFLSREDLPVSGSMKVMRLKLRDNLADYEELPLSGRSSRRRKKGKSAQKSRLRMPGPTKRSWRR